MGGAPCNPRGRLHRGRKSRLQNGFLRIFADFWSSETEERSPRGAPRVAKCAPCQAGSNALITTLVHPHGEERRQWSWRLLLFSDGDILSFDRQDFERSFDGERMTEIASKVVIFFV